MIWIGTRPITTLGSDMEAEAEAAIRWAVCTMTAFQYRRVIVESDSQVLVKMINGEEEIWPVLRPIIQHIHQTLLTAPEYVVVYQQRGENKAADRVAKETFSFPNNVPRLYSIVPSWLNSVVEMDKPLYEQVIG